MRLTLRTMLAYMDKILEEDDARDLGQKIEDSEFAKTLMHRIHDVTRRLRLGVPRLEGRGMGLDPNTVAEYLDNTLPSERVPDFEKVCLESDVHLAEVASAHQVLALVLGEPAEIDPNSRQRMYGLIHQPAAEAGAQPRGTPVAVAAPGTATSGKAAKAGKGKAAKRKPRRRQRPIVPDYLREPDLTDSGTVSRWALAAVLLLLTFGGLFIAFGPESNRERLRLAMGIAQTDEPTTDDAQPPAIAGGTSDGEVGTADKSDGGADDAEEVDADLPLPLDTDNTVDADAVDLGATDPDAGDGDANLAIQPADLDEMPADEETPPARPSRLKRPPERGRNLPDADLPADIADADAPPLPIVPKGDDMPAKSDRPAKSDGPAPEVAADDAAADDTDAAMAKEKQDARDLAAAKASLEETAVSGLGRVTSTQREVLLRWDPATRAWVRLPTRAVVNGQERLVAVPAFRPTITLTSGVAVQVFGDSIIELDGADTDGDRGIGIPGADVPGIHMIQGRMVLLAVGKGESRVRLKAGPYEGLLVFRDAESTAAIEVIRSHPDGQDPEKFLPNVEFNLYAYSGAVRWISGPDANEQLIQAPAHRLVHEAGAIEMAATVSDGKPAGDTKAADAKAARAGSDAIPRVVFPKWISGDDRSDIERRGADIVVDYLQGDQPVSLALKELSVNRRAEVCALAARSLALIDEFDGCVPLLNDPAQRTSRANQIDGLRRALARGPETAAAVRMAFEQQRGARATELYRMLWAYDKETLDTETVTRLVEALEDPDLDFRSLAIWNLYRITGDGAVFYRAEDTPAKRAPYVLKWKQKLENGSIVPKKPKEKKE